MGIDVSWRGARHRNQRHPAASAMTWHGSGGVAAA